MKVVAGVVRGCALQDSFCVGVVHNFTSIVDDCGESGVWKHLRDMPEVVVDALHGHIIDALVPPTAAPTAPLLTQKKTQACQLQHQWLPRVTIGA